MTQAIPSKKLTLLSDLKAGERGVLVGFKNEALATKVLSMGALPGSILIVERKAPFNGALYIRKGNDLLAIGIHEAGLIEIAR